jgi:Bacterial PH domain
MRLADTTPAIVPVIAARYLMPHEVGVTAVRQHPAVLAGPVITAVAGLTAAAIVAPAISSGHGALYAAVWIAALLLLCRAILKVMSWSSSYFVATSYRIMVITGTFNRRVAAIPFGVVNDFSYVRSPVGRRLGFGELLVRYGARDQVLQRIQYIPYPEQLYQEIRQKVFGSAEAPWPDDEPAGGERADDEQGT